MITLKRRDPSLSIRAAQAAILAQRQWLHLSVIEFASPAAIRASTRATAYQRLAADARMFGL